MVCAALCPIESVQFSPSSPGPVLSTEIIVRDDFDPMHGRGGVKLQHFRLSEILSGSHMSIWRTSHVELLELAERPAPNVDKLQTRRGFITAEVAALRDIKWNNSIDAERSICVIDDTQINDEGEHHPAHAGLKFCGAVLRLENLKETKEFATFKNLLKLCFTPHSYPRA